MSETTIETARIHPEAFELAEILRPSWARLSAELDAAGVLRCEGDDDEVKISKKELDAFKKKAAEGDKAAKKVEAAEKAATEAAEKVEALEQKLEAADDSSEVEKLTKRVERAEAKAEAAETGRKDAEEKAAKAQVERTGVSVAQRLGFRKPNQAIKLLDSDDLESEADFEQALERLAREEPYLVQTKKQRQVEDPKRNGGDPPDPDEDPETDPKPKEKDEATGPARLRNYYEAEEKKREKAAQGADGGEDD